MLMLFFAGGGGDHHFQECEKGSQRQVVGLYIAKSMMKSFSYKCFAASSETEKDSNKLYI